MSKRVLVVYDVEGWAWHRRSLALAKYGAAHGYRVDIAAQRDYESLDDLDGYDGILWFSWQTPPRKSLLAKTWTFIASEGVMHEHGRQTADVRSRMCSESCDRRLAAKILPRYKGVIVINPRAVDAVRAMHPRTEYLQTGVDVQLFSASTERPPADRLRVGWCGKIPHNGRWTAKGYHEVLEPLMTQLPGIDWRVNTNTYVNALSARQMCDWYSELDVFLCTSAAEGTPSVLLEAAACGCALVSTSVGMAPDVIGADDRGMLLGTWTNQAEADRLCRRACAYLRYLDHDRAQLNTFARRAQRAVCERYDWAKLAPQWLDLITR